MTDNDYLEYLKIKSPKRVSFYIESESEEMKHICRKNAFFIGAYDIRKCTVNLKRFDEKWKHKAEKSTNYSIISDGLNERTITHQLKPKNTKLSKNFKTDLGLSEKDLLEKEWLTDIEINKFLVKLKDYNEMNNIFINGLDDPILLKSRYLNRANENNEWNFIQIINSNDDHWVCVTNGLNADISLYDTIERDNIDTQLGTTSASILDKKCRKKNHITFQIKEIQRQRGNFHCGYFALANAMAICLGLDPEMIIFTGKEIIKHYIDIIFHNKPMEMFPYKLRKHIKRIERKTLKFDIRKIEFTD